MAKTECPLGRRCHVQGKSLTTWGKTIPQKVVLAAAATSVQLVAGGKKVASGTLVWNNVVLCAFHSIANQSPSDLEALMGFEFGADTAPGGHAEDYLKNPEDFLKGTALATTPQAKVVQFLEQQAGLDFAFLRIEWKSAKTRESGLRTVSLPRRPDFPSPGNSVKKGEEVFVVGHPWTGGEKLGEVTQASVGIVTKTDGPYPGTTTGIEFTYSTMIGRTGFSGAGVFNKQGQIVGVYKGSDPSLGVAFVNLGLAAASFNVAGKRPTSNRLRQWLGGGKPILDSEKKDDVILTGP